MEFQVERMLEKDLDSLVLQDFDDFWNMNILRNDIKQDSSVYVVCKLGGDIVGFAGINVLCDEAHIANIAVRKDRRRSGVGAMLLAELIRVAKESCALITLEVSEQNVPAIGLYEKYGFVVVGKRKKYYSGLYDAYIMTCTFE